MKVLFTVQGEGRGHLTQALAMREMLARRGHDVVGVLVGSNGSRPLPAYFAAAFTAEVQEMVSPGFVFQNARGISNRATLHRVVRHFPRYRRALRLVRETITRTQPDVILNFLEPTMGLHNFLHGARVPTVVVGHQYMCDHPSWVRPPRHRLQQHLMRAYCALVGSHSTRLALSFYPAPDVPEHDLYVSPPLLRQHLFELEPVTGDYLLVYLLNHGYADAIRRWHTLHPQIPVHCFYDRPGAPEEETVRPGLTFHRLHGEKFLQMMAGARAVACTAGFESVSEAACLGKPLLLIPVENHVEQYLNACDAEQAGIGMMDPQFQLSRLLGPQARRAGPHVRRWMARAESVAMRVVEAAAGLGSAPARDLPEGAPLHPEVSPLTRETAA